MSIAIGEEFLTEQEGNPCFGCGHSNEHGLHLTFKRMEPSVVESRVAIPSHLSGPAGIVHGGIQALLLDEVMGAAAYCVAETPAVLTAEMSVRYKGSVPTGQTLIVRAVCTGRDDKNMFLEGTISVPDGSPLTTATARFRVFAAPRT